MEGITVKGLARLLIQSLNNGGNYDWCNVSDIPNLQKKPVSTIGNIMKKAGLKKHLEEDKKKMCIIIESISPECFTNYESFNIFGCETSRDIDICILTRDLTKPLLTSEKERFYSELKQTGYDIERDIDINLVQIDKNGFVNFSKGGNEAINIIFYTYDLHTQKYPIIFSKEIELDILPKIQSFSKFIMDRLESLTTTNYNKLRDEKKNIYNKGGIERIDFVIKCFEFFDLDPFSGKFDYDVWKSITLKFLQLILFNDVYFNKCDSDSDSDSKIKKKNYYRKMGILELYYNYSKNKDEIDVIKSLFTRIPLTIENTPIFKKFVEFMHIKFNEIAYENTPSLKWNIQYYQYNQSDKNPTPLSDELFNEWYKNPIMLSSDFIKIWFDNYGDGNITIDDKFIKENNLIFLDLIPKIKKNVITHNQKTSEWKELLKYYCCGNNTGVKVIESDDPNIIIKERANLIMGCIGEEIISNNYDFSTLIPIHSDFESCTIGMIVEKIGIEQSIGSCPDQLFISKSSNEIIPAEFKTIEGRPSTNKSYIRSFSLAKKQIKRCANILNTCDNGICKRGIIVFLWIYYDEQQSCLVYEMNGGILQI
jgi:hypothetical protein